MKRHFEHSYKFGKQQEIKILPIIEEYFNDNITQTTNQYDKYDFISTLYNFELKSRTNIYKKYNTTMITGNKLKETDKQLILLFNFTDSLYYIKYNEEVFNTFEKKLFKREGVCTYPLEHFFIPIEKLTLIKKYL
jgi:hypothetical protein